jgi:hypothetical protein
MPVWDKVGRADGTFLRDDFTYDPIRDLYTCRDGKVLKTTGRVHDGKTLLYRSSKQDCDPCPLKPRCCPNAPQRKVPRDINQAARDHACALREAEPYLQSARDWKKIERLFGDAKRNLAMTRLRQRGLAGSRDEFLMTTTLQNLRRRAKLASIPPPSPASTITPGASPRLGTQKSGRFSMPPPMPCSHVPSDGPLSRAGACGCKRPGDARKSWSRWPASSPSSCTACGSTDRTTNGGKEVAAR